ncbi:ABC transporter permease [Chloroflexota bacterium]
MDEVQGEIRAPAPVEGKRHNLFVDVVVRMVKTKPLGTVGAVIVLILFVTGIFADLLAPFGYNEMFLVDRLAGPSATHFLGTDHLGRDMLSRIIYGARISMIIGVVGSLFAITVSIAIGLVSGYVGGKTDMIVQRFVDAWMSIPSLMILLTLMTILGPGLWQVVCVLGPVFGIRGSRITRSAVIAIKENMYVAASKAIGAPTGRILTKHILPNVMAPIIISFTTSMGMVILMEATISFLGFGIPPPTPSWGGMLSGPGRQYMTIAPWLVFWPGLALALVVYGINMLGDALRDLLDPRLRGGLGRYGRVKVSGSVVGSQTEK